MQKILEPPKEEIEDLLFNQMMSKKKVALYYSVSKKTLNTWMRKYDLVNKTSIELQQLKRKNTKKLEQIALEGRTIIKPGFNSKFIEEYAIEREAEKRRRQDNKIKRKDGEKLKKVRRIKNI